MLACAPWDGPVGMLVWDCPDNDCCWEFTGGTACGEDGSWLGTEDVDAGVADGGTATCDCGRNSVAFAGLKGESSPFGWKSLTEATL